MTVFQKSLVKPSGKLKVGDTVVGGGHYSKDVGIIRSINNPGTNAVVSYSTDGENAYSRNVEIGMLKPSKLVLNRRASPLKRMGSNKALEKSDRFLNFVKKRLKTIPVGYSYGSHDTMGNLDLYVKLKSFKMFGRDVFILKYRGARMEKFPARIWYGIKEMDRKYPNNWELFSFEKVEGSRKFMLNHKIKAGRD